jgi:septal ring factor EnvC (AmiA/AmiB activator)
MLEKRLDRAEIDIIELESKVKEMEKTLVVYHKRIKNLEQEKSYFLTEQVAESTKKLGGKNQPIDESIERVKKLEEKKCLWLEREGNCNGCEGKENKTCPLEEKLLRMHILPKGE